MDETKWLAFQPDADRFFEALRPQMTDDMLRLIAALDYDTDQGGHFNELMQLRDQPYTARALGFTPKEVLQLGESGPPFPNYTNDALEIDAKQERLAHAFIVANILRYMMDFAPQPMLEHVLATSGSLAVLTVNGEISGISPQDTISLLAWVAPRLPSHTEDLPFIAVAIAYITISRSVNVADGALDELLDWAWSLEMAEAADLAFGRGLFQRDLLGARWKQIGQALCDTTLDKAPGRACEIGDFILANT